jgi:hypothetical protein
MGMPPKLAEKINATIPSLVRYTKVPNEEQNDILNEEQQSKKEIESVVELEDQSNKEETLQEVSVISLPEQHKPRWIIILTFSPLILPLLVGCCICIYSITDNLGVEAMNPTIYNFWTNFVST